VGLALWQSHFGAAEEGSSVPEPATRWALWTALTLGAALRRL